MFGGIGGFRLGLEKANKSISETYGQSEGIRGHKSDSIVVRKWWRTRNAFSCVGYADHDKYVVECYNENFKEKHKPTDAKKLTEADVPDFDLLVAGFPCQSFSLAGKRKGFNDTRGTLFHEIIRLAEMRKPSHLLLENVKGLLSAQGGYCFATIIKSLSELGYCVEWEVLNSKNFGVAQNRERVFIHCFREGSRQEIFPLGQSSEVLEESLGGEQESREGVCSTLDSGCGRLRGQGENYVVIPTLTTELAHSSFEMTCGIEIGNPIRRLTPVECERLQGFPDDWTSMLSDTRRYKALGNAVTVNVIQAIGEELIIDG